MTKDKKTLSILIADDHSVVRAGLKQILNDLSRVISIDEAKDGNETVEKACSRDYDIIILDIAMPGINGLDALKEIKKCRPDSVVLVLSMYPEEQYAVRVLKAGAAGYLTKESAPDELIDAIERVIEGKKYLSDSMAERILVEIDPSHKKPHYMLSDREFQVLCMLASGRTLSDIAEELSLSVKTVSTYKSRIFEKMGFKNNAELIKYALKHNLIYINSVDK